MQSFLSNERQDSGDFGLNNLFSPMQMYDNSHRDSPTMNTGYGNDNMELEPIGNIVSNHDFSYLYNGWDPFSSEQPAKKQQPSSLQRYNSTGDTSASVSQNTNVPSFINQSVNHIAPTHTFNMNAPAYNVNPYIENVNYLPDNAHFHAYDMNRPPQNMSLPAHNTEHFSPIMPHSATIVPTPTSNTNTRSKSDNQNPKKNLPVLVVNRVKRILKTRMKKGFKNPGGRLDYISSILWDMEAEEYNLDDFEGFLTSLKFGDGRTWVVIKTTVENNPYETAHKVEFVSALYSIIDGFLGVDGEADFDDWMENGSLGKKSKDTFKENKSEFQKKFREEFRKLSL